LGFDLGELSKSKIGYTDEGEQEPYSGLLPDVSDSGYESGLCNNLILKTKNDFP
jgi:hypothetical protein